MTALALCVAGLACACGPSAYRTDATVPRDARVVIIMIDGPRYSETFGDSLHTHVPGMWNTLCKQGALCSNFRNIGETLTNPGHGTVLTGVLQHIDNTGHTRPAEPTLFEYYRKATGAPAADAVLVGGKAKLDAVAHSTSAEYGAPYGASTEFTSANDRETYDRLIARLDRDSPHVVMCSFSDVDLAGHRGNWSDYLRRIDVVDSLVVLTWEHLQADPHYAGKTYLFVTADHGRHEGGGGAFQHHGCDCDGCRHIICLALGPGIAAGKECRTVYSQQDVCKTAGMVLGIPTSYTTGVVMQDLFVQPLTRVPH